MNISNGNVQGVFRLE